MPFQNDSWCECGSHNLIAVRLNSLKEGYSSDVNPQSEGAITVITNEGNDRILHQRSEPCFVPFLVDDESNPEATRPDLKG